MKFRKQFDLLTNLLEESDKTKSSHWKHQLKDFKVNNDKTISGNDCGFGNYEPNTLIRKIYHNVFQRLLFGNKIFSSTWYNIMKQAAESQCRVINLDALRHVFTLDLINRYVLQETKINYVCVIGDGRTNFISPSLRSRQFRKVISVNLVEILLSDLLLIDKENFLEENQVCIAQTDELFSAMLLEPEIRLILIPSFNAAILFEQGIELFVNISSFQEITYDIIRQYFDIIKSNNSYLYCCNRERKTLIGGEVLVFNEYPWDNPALIIDEYCPWHQTYYDMKSGLPFFFRYDGKTKHRLVKYS